MKRVLLLPALAAAALVAGPASAQPVDLASVLPPGRIETGGATGIAPGLYEAVEIRLDWRDTVITADQVLARPDGLVAFDVRLTNDRGTLVAAELEADLAALRRLDLATRPPEVGDQGEEAAEGSAPGTLRLEGVEVVRSGALERRLTFASVEIAGWHDEMLDTLRLQGVEAVTPTGILRAGELAIDRLPLTSEIEFDRLATSLEARDLAAEGPGGASEISVASLSIAVDGLTSLRAEVEEARLAGQALKPLDLAQQFAGLGIDPIAGSGALSIDLDPEGETLRISAEADIEGLGRVSLHADAADLDLTQTIPLEPLGLPISIPVATLVSAQVGAVDAGFGERSGIVWPDLVRGLVPSPFLDRLPILLEAAERLQDTGTVTLSFEPEEPVTILAALRAALTGSLAERLGASLGD